MLKVYVPNISKTSIGGGFTFLRNFRKAVRHEVQFVDSWDKGDIVFIFGVTAIDKAEIYEAHKLGKKIILRCDNIPRRSRNKRMSPAERLAEFGAMAEAVVYQSEWARKYAGYFIENENEFIVTNGVDPDVFNINGRESDGHTYLYINYNDNPNKRFDEALYWFDMEWRHDNSNHLWIAGNVPRVYLEHPEFNWDLPTNGKVEYKGIMKTPEDVARLMKQCDFILYPSFAEAAPNMVIEALACGLEILYPNSEGGTLEMIELHKNNPYTIQQMGRKYLEIFQSLI